jgi:hypothetical protein
VAAAPPAPPAKVVDEGASAAQRVPS